MTNKNKPLVVVLSRNYSTGLGVIRSLGSAGYTVDLIASTKKRGSSIIASCSKYVNNCVEVLSPKIQGDNGEKLIEQVMKYANSSQKVVLFPTDDFTASVVASNYELLKEHFFMPEIKGKTLLEVMDKECQSNFAKEAGLLVPKEWIVSLKGDIVIPDDVVYPCFVKPTESISGRKCEMIKCDSQSQLASHLTKIKEYYADRSVLIQEFLSIDKEYDLSGVCLGENVIIPAIIEKIRISKHELGVTMMGKIIPLDTLGDAKEKIFSLLKSLNYFGMFDMELNLCGDKLYFNEINLRSGGPNYSYYLNGVNLPDIFVKEITGASHSKDEEIIKTYGKTFVYEKIAWEDYIHSHITKKELKEVIDSADYKLLADKNDLAPNKIFFRRIRLSAIKHRVLTILGKE